MARALVGTRWIKRALLLVIIGLVVQLFCLYDITPGTFVVFTGVGVGLVGLGWLLLAVGLRRTQRFGTKAGDA